MKPEWTEDQKKAINSDGRGIIVSAAAGSGKTAVLIERIIKRLSEKNGVPADKLLAVTFTTDAAAQMRDKLNAAFEKKLAEDPDNSWLLSQQNLLQLARISTINSFCLDLVKENLNQFEFQGGLKILDETEDDLIFEKSYENALLALCEENPQEYEKLYNAFGDGSTLNSKLFKICKSLYNFLRSLPFRDRWIEKAYSFYNDDEKIDEAINECYEETLKELDETERLISKLRFFSGYTVNVGGTEYCLRDYTGGILDELKGKNKEPVPGNISIANDEVSLLRKLSKDKNWNELSNYFPPDFKQMRGRNEKSLPDDIKNILTDARAECSAVLKKIKQKLSDISNTYKVPEERIRANMKIAGELFLMLCRFADRIEKCAYEIKLEKNAVDFADVELMAKELLVEETDSGYKRTELAESIRSSHMYEIIMIDEFQDVNNLQDIIFKAISDSENPEIMGKNIFVVGDIKQAIYGFRLTNPMLFKNALDMANKQENADKLQAIYLKMNFRSRQGVVDFVNFLFTQLMSVQCGEVDYTEKERLERGAKYSERAGGTEVMLIDQTDDYDKSIGYSQENSAVAKRIKKLIDDREQVYDNGTDRPCRPSDICILVQKNKEKKRMALALEAVGLKAKTEDDEGYINSREISIMLNILRVIDNPMNDIALTAVMMSPVLNFSPDDMVKVRKHCLDKKMGYQNHIFQVLTAADSSKKDADEKEAEFIDMGDEQLQSKCERTYRLFDTLRYYSMSMSLERLIRKIFDMTDLMGITTLFRDSAKKRANLRLLLEYASQYEMNSNDGISGFLRYVDSVSGNDKAFKQAVTVTESADSVNIMTYHGSKGLEFPFVFLCELCAPVIDSRKTSFYRHNEYGAAFDYDDKEKLISKVNLHKKRLKKICEGEDKSERMRLLYVGCTRAKEKLFISYAMPTSKKFENSRSAAANLVKSVSDYEKIPESITAEQNSMLDWITLALAKYPNNENFLEWLGLSGEHIVKADSDGAKIKFVEYETEEQESEKQTKAESQQADDELVRKLIERYKFKYDDSLTQAPSKLTVTEIVKAEKEKEAGDKNPEFYPNLPRLDEEIDKLTAAEKGTFTHKFMELADYSSAEKNVKAELERLVAGGFFTKKEASGVYVDSLNDFFKGDFYKRMKNSDDVRREQKFLVSIGDLNLPENLKNISGEDGMIQGIADCIFKENGEWVLVDYKTDNFSCREDMLKYGTQLALYKAAFELILEEKIKSCYIYSFKLREGVEIKL